MHDSQGRQLSDWQKLALPPRPTVSEDQKRIIKSSADALTPDVFGTKVTARMYQMMLEDHTKLNDIFSYSKQMTGKQPLALAKSVHAYASHIYDLTPILPVVEGIAHKHASLHIEPYQYNVVGTYLMQALGEVLGDAFTPELQDAWAAGYWALAYVFIDAERALYDAAGWEGWRDFVVAKRVKEADGITSFYFKPKDGKPLKPYHPGQFVSVQVYVDSIKSKQSRQYSLSDTPNSEYFRISVKREPGSTDASGVHHPAMISNLIHDTKQEGSEVELSFPFGEFFLDKTSPASPTSPVVLLSVGVGLTPLLSMLNTIVGPHNEADGKILRPATWIQGLRHPSEHPFLPHIQDLAIKYPNQLKTVFFYSKPTAVEQSVFGEGEFQGRTDVAEFLKTPDSEASELLQISQKDAQYYMCGLTDFMKKARADLIAAGVDNSRIYEETFIAT